MKQAQRNTRNQIGPVFPKKDFKNNDKYSMNRKQMGQFLIFNQIEFDPRGDLADKTRNGSQKDEKALRQAMMSLGFEIHSFKNLKTGEIMKKINHHSFEQDHRNCNAFGLAFFSHGDERGNLYTFDDRIHINDLVKPFVQQTYLVGKPKLFFIQGIN